MSIALASVWITIVLCLTTVAMFWIDAHRDQKKKARPPIDPEQILAERFARGELDEGDYAQRLAVLRMGPPLEVYFDR